MSSIDVHSQVNYQWLIKEGIAIVCSLVDQKNKAFRLTPEGVEELIKCNKNASQFHTHEKMELYEEATNVIYDQQIKFNITDRRYILKFINYLKR